MPTFEVFLKGDARDGFRHAGALDAPDAELALLLARECYSRRGEGTEMWLVERSHVVVAPRALTSPNLIKPHRSSDGAEIAARRKRLRSDAPIAGDG